MSNAHPTYPNPTIQEAVCEIHFRLQESIAWNPAIFGELFKRIGSEFPNLEPAMRVGVELQVGAKGISQALLPPPQQWMRYRHATRNLLLQLSENIFTVNVLPKYPGWARMKEDILASWAKAREVIKPDKIMRIGLRYINRIERTHPDERPGDWLAPSDYIPKAVLSSLSGFLSRLEARTDPHSWVIVTLGEMSDTSGQGRAPIILDIDCIVEKEIGTSEDAITEEIQRLHDTAWSVFSVSMTPRLERLLQGGEP